MFVKPNTIHVYDPVEVPALWTAVKSSVVQYRRVRGPNSLGPVTAIDHR